jgi:hypothetical protein
MKKLSFLLLLGGFLFNAQSVQAQAVEKGKILIDGYVGGPNLLTGLLKAIATSNDPAQSGITIGDIKSGGMIPIGAKVEYLVSDKFGLGLEGNYANSSLAAKIDDGAGTVIDGKVAFPRTRIMALANYHFGKSDKLDWYLGLAAGFNGTKANITGTSTDPDVQQFFTDAKTVGKGLTRIPVAAGLHFGTHIYFTDNIGLNLEIASGGGPILKGGIAIKI